MTLDEATRIGEVIRQSEDAAYLASLLSDAFPEFVWTAEMAGPHVVGMDVQPADAELRNPQ